MSSNWTLCKRRLQEAPGVAPPLAKNAAWNVIRREKSEELHQVRGFGGLFAHLLERDFPCGGNSKWIIARRFDTIQKFRATIVKIFQIVSYGTRSRFNVSAGVLQR